MTSLLAYSVSEAATVAALGRSTVYAAIRRGELTARKSGRRTVVLVADLEAWLKALPPIKTKTTPASGASAGTVIRIGPFARSVGQDVDEFRYLVTSNVPDGRHPTSF